MNLKISCVVLYLITATASLSDYHTLEIQRPNMRTHFMNDMFLSVALDACIIAENYKNFNMNDPRILTLASFLSPGYLRVGGNLADKLYFSEDYSEELPNTCDCYNYVNYINNTTFIMSGLQWVELNNFAKEVGLTILFDLNSLIRNEDGSWDPTNAKELIEFTDKHKFDVSWQLGNEPDSYKHKYNYSVNATQLAKDFSTLKNILKKFPRYKNSLLVGPDVTRPRPEHTDSAKYLEAFLKGSEHILSAITWHQYYLNGRVAVLDDFSNPDTFFILEEQLKFTLNIVSEAGFDNTPVWLGETSTVYGGGTPGLSDSYVGTFLWLDKLGMSAQYGLQTVIRQSLFGANYALIDKDYKPTPDWWVSVFFKKMLGSKVVDCNIIGVSTSVRLYCHCAKSSSVFNHDSALTVYGINLNNSTKYVEINDVHPFAKEAYAYIFTGENLTSKKILLNGEILQLTEDGQLPPFHSEIVNPMEALKMPPYSLVFWVLPNYNMCVSPTVVNL